MIKVHVLKGMKAAAILFLLTVSIAGIAWAQSGSGSVNGIVQDSTGAVIVKATVSLVNLDTNVEVRSVTNSAGLFVFPAVTNGRYKLTVNSPGMAQYEGELTVQVDGRASVSATLHPAGTKTTVVVGDVTPLVNTEDAQLGSTLEFKRVEELPLNGRDVMSLLSTVAGTTPSDVNGNFRTFGGGVGSHDVTLDGAPLTDMAYGSQSVDRQPGLESIQEFTVETNGTSAKYARSTDIIMVTKSGTNQWHGSLFETNRDNAYGYAHARGDAPGSKPGKLIRNEYGGSAGGPIVIPRLYDGKNKSFWFFSYEALRRRAGTTASFRVPSDRMRNGDFNEAVDPSTLKPINIYNPFVDFATPGDASTRPQFHYQGHPNTINPAVCTSTLGAADGCMSPFYAFLLSDIPKATLSNVNPFLGANYFAPKPNLVDNSTYVLRVDQKFGDKDLVYVRLSNSTLTQINASGYGLQVADQTSNLNALKGPNKGFSANWNHTFSPTLVNDLTLSASNPNETEGGAGPLKNWDAQLGLPNPNNTLGFPTISNIGIGSGNYLAPHYAFGHYFAYFVLDDNATKLLGKHELQFGVHLRYDQLTYWPQQQRAQGTVGFARTATGLYDPSHPDRKQGQNFTGSIAASAFLGFDSYSYRSVKGKYYMTRKEDAGYIQDNYKFNHRLTVNLGIRWDYNPFPVDKQGAITGFDLKNNALVTGSSLEHLYKVGATTPGYVANLQSLGVKFETTQQANLPKNLVSNNWHDIGPHVGFAYRALDGRKSFVLRAGYALNFYPLAIWGWNDSMKNNAPWRQDPSNVDPYNTSSTSPDGVQNYGLVTSPAVNSAHNFTNILGGLNSAHVFNGAASPNDALNNGNINDAFFDQNSPSPRIHNWNVTVEKELPAKTVLKLSYIANHTSNLDMYQDLNQYMNGPYNAYGAYNWETRMGTYLPQGGPSGLYADQSIRPLAALGTLGVPGGYAGAPDDQNNPKTPWSDIQEYGRYGWGNSWGGVAELQRPFQNGFGFQIFYDLVDSFAAGGYGWESGIDPVTSWPVGQVPTDLHERIKQLYYSQDTTIPKQEIRYNFIAELPFGRGKLIGSDMPKALDAIVGGWQINALGSMHSNSFYVEGTTNNSYGLFPTGAPVKYYGHSAPIQDCRSGDCISGYLLYNGYIPADAVNKPGGVMGVPTGYTPAYAPLNNNPADPDNVGTNNVPVVLYNTPASTGCSNTTTLSAGSYCVDMSPLANFNPLTNRVMQSTWLFNTDSSILKTFKMGEHMRLKVEADFFNVFNNPGNEFANNNPSGNGLNDSSGIVLKNYNINSSRQVQLSGRLTF